MADHQWEEKNYSYFCNQDCEYFPCHQTEDNENFNCLFCYCPLYVLGKDCGGNFSYLPNGYKDCTNCILPHKKENYGKIVQRYGEIVEIMQNNDKNYQ